MAATNATFPKTPKSLIQPNANKAEHEIVNEFHGYRAKEDLTSLSSGFLVPGSQNVITLATGQIAVRGGYSLDGQAGSGNGGVTSSFDWKSHTGAEKHLRVDSVNGKLQFRYVASAGQSWNGNSFAEGQIFWIDLVTGLTSTQTAINFAVYWDATDLIQKLLYVNGDTAIYEWSGGVATVASVTSNTITIQGASTFAQLGFLQSGTRKIDINGTQYTYTGGDGTTTITGVTPDPTVQNPAAGSVLFQVVRTNANSASTGVPSAFTNYLIEILKNQVYLASTKSNFVYISKTNSFTDFSYTSPQRLVGEGALITADAAIVALVPQEDTMYVSAGLDWWYSVKFTLTSDNKGEALTITPLKTSPGQAAISQAGVFKVKNAVMFISNEPAIDDLGRVEQNLAFPETVTITDSIRSDFLKYDFTNASGIYYRYFLLIALPKPGLVLIYNFTKNWWEAPQILPIRRFAIIGGLLYGHSSLTNETYRLFTVDARTSATPYNDNGNPINAIAAFSYMNYGERSWKKTFNEIYTEGNIQTNTNISLAAKYDFGGFTSIKLFNILGSSNFIISTSADGSIGKNPIGSNPIGSVTDSPTDTPKWRQIFTAAPLDFYEWQPVFQTNAADFYWELLAFGVNAKLSQTNNNEIKT